MQANVPDQYQLLFDKDYQAALKAELMRMRQARKPVARVTSQQLAIMRDKEQQAKKEEEDHARDLQQQAMKVAKERFFKRGSVLVNFVIPDWWCDDNKTAAIYYTVPPQLQPHRWFSTGIYSKVATFFSKRAWAYVLDVDSCPTEDSAERLDWQAGWVDYPSGTEAVLWTTDWHKILVRRVRSAEARQILHEAHLRRQKARRDARQLRKAGPGRELPGAE